MNAFLFLGFILLIITVIAKPFLKSKVTVENCPNDVKAVKNNKLYFNIFLIISIVLIIIGIVLLLI